MSDPSIIDPASIDRLSKLCGMFGSDHDGERASAALKADALVRRLGMTWREVLSRPVVTIEAEPITSPSRWCEPQTDRQAITELLRHADLLTDWEQGFVRSLSTLYRRLTPKQAEVLGNICDRLRDHFERGGGQ